MFGFDDVLGVAKAFGPIVGGALGFMGGEDTNQANSAQSQAQMDFQERMSNTSYQRAVADMKAAGLNPMLAYSQGGASSPGGSQAVMQNSSAAGAAAAQSAASVDLTRASTQKTLAEAKNTEAEAESRIALLKQQALGGVSSAAHTDQLAERARQQNEGRMGSFEALSANARSGSDYYKELGDKRYYLAGEPGRHDYSDPRVSVERAHARTLTARAILDELEQPHGRAESGYWDDVGKGGVYAERGSAVVGRLANSAASVGLRLPRRFNELTIRGAGGSISRSGQR